MGMSYGRYVGYRLLNAAIVLFLAVLLMSALFTKLAITTYTTQVQNVVMQEEKAYTLKHHTAPTKEWIKKETKYWRHYYHLDEPFYKQVWKYTIDTLTVKPLKLGSIQISDGWGKSLRSISGTKSVWKQIKEALPRTILLFTTAQIIVILIGIALGVKSAQNPGSLGDRFISVLAMVTTSLPMWWLGMLMILLFVVKLDWLPITLYSQVAVSGVKQLLEKMTLPLATIVVVLFGGWAWTIRNIMIGTLQEDFIMAARAKGVPENKVIYGHALRASAPPIITMIIFGMLGSLGGAIITEIVFNWPGMGMLYWHALARPPSVRTLMAENYIFAILTVFSMVLADLLYAWIDPRVRIGAAARS